MLDLKVDFGFEIEEELSRELLFDVYGRVVLWASMKSIKEGDTFLKELTLWCAG